MHHRHPFRSLVIAAAAIGLAAPASAQTGSADYDNLVSMLASAPDTTRVRGSQIIADYVDYRALESAASAPQPASVDELGALGLVVRDLLENRLELVFERVGLLAVVAPRVAPRRKDRE